MTFKKWILEFNDVKLPIGDLAKDISSDKNFPKVNSYEVILSHLESARASDAAIETFENVWKFYVSSR